MSRYFSWSSSTSSQGSRTVRTISTFTQNGKQVMTANSFGNSSSTSGQPTMNKEAKKPSPGNPSSSSGQPTMNKEAKKHGPSTSKSRRTSFDSIDINKLETEVLDEHNRLRALHKCPPLSLNRELCNFATEWAEKLAMNNRFEHRPNNKYGENIFMSFGLEVNGIRPVKTWYDEIEMYSFDKHAFSTSTGHFTQVVWKGSKEIGIGIGQRDGSTYVVANYDPPGNVIGAFEQNVPRPQKRLQK